MTFGPIDERFLDKLGMTVVRLGVTVVGLGMIGAQAPSVRRSRLDARIERGKDPASWP
jgi:hypothetical protein